MPYQGKECSDSYTGLGSASAGACPFGLPAQVEPAAFANEAAFLASTCFEPLQTQCLPDGRTIVFDPKPATHSFVSFVDSGAFPSVPTNTWTAPATLNLTNTGCRPLQGLVVLWAFAEVWTAPANTAVAARLLIDGFPVFNLNSHDIAGPFTAVNSAFPPQNAETMATWAHPFGPIAPGATSVIRVESSLGGVNVPAATIGGNLYSRFAVIGVNP